MFLGYNSPTQCYINEKINTSMKSLLPLPSTFYHKNIEDLVFNFNVQETYSDDHFPQTQADYAKEVR